MQVNETLSEGLKREFTIVVPSSDVEAEVEGRLIELSKTVKMKGFRPGKVPLSIIRRQQKLRHLPTGHVLLNRYWRLMSPNGYSTYFKREMKKMPGCERKTVGCMAIRHSVITHFRRGEMKITAEKAFADRCMHKSTERNKQYRID